MPGPWIRAALDPDFAGDQAIHGQSYYEITLYDDSLADQGTGIVYTLSAGKVGEAVSAEFVCSSNVYYGWWMEHVVKDKEGDYHFCTTTRDKCKFKKKDVFHVDSFRLLEGADLTEDTIKWLKGPGGEAPPAARGQNGEVPRAKDRRGPGC